MKSAPKYDYWPFILPFLIFMVAGFFEPKFDPPAEDETRVEDNESSQEPEADGALNEEANTTDDYETQFFQAEVNRYVWSYAIKIAIVGGLLVFFWRAYISQFPIAVTWLAFVVGIVGVVVWVAACQIGIEDRIMTLIGLGSDTTARSAFNPFASLPDNWHGFLIVRFIGLAVVVPICEELFLRGFLMRFVQSPDWWTVPLAQMGTKALVVAPIYGALTHPAEMIAAVLWFSLVTWLMRRTGNFWDCVVAHAVTNLLLGIYIIAFSQWQLW